MKKQYQVSLNKEIVEKAKLQALDSKLSPIINNLLRAWVEYRGQVEELIYKIKREEDKG